jgi:hypothetical protein
VILGSPFRIPLGLPVVAVLGHPASPRPPRAEEERCGQRWQKGEPAGAEKSGRRSERRRRRGSCSTASGPGASRKATSRLTSGSKKWLQQTSRASGPTIAAASRTSPRSTARSPKNAPNPAKPSTDRSSWHAALAVRRPSTPARSRSATTRWSRRTRWKREYSSCQPRVSITKNALARGSFYT